MKWNNSRSPARLGTAVATGLIFAAAACGHLVAGGVRDVRAVAVGDGTPESSGQSAGAARSVSSSGAPIVPQGTIAFDATVTLIGESGERVPLSQAPRSAQVRIEGTDSALVASGRIDDAAYTRARVVFYRVRANVNSGLAIGGISISGDVNVQIAAGDSIVVERPVALPPGSAPVTLVIDLNASSWLLAANPLSRLVAASAFTGAVDLRAR